MSLNQGRTISSALAFDTKNLDQLKLQAGRDPKAAIGAVSKQFEAVFLNMVLKSMREATPQEGLFDNEQTRLYTSMLDQQLAQHIATRGTGLSEVMARQLTRGLAGVDAPDQSATADAAGAPLTLAMLAPVPAPWKQGAPSAPALNPDAPEIPENPEIPDMPYLPMVPKAAVPAAAAVPATAATPIPISHTRDFVNRVWNHAVDAARSIGVKPQFVVGQAALESGWGKHEIRASDGSSTYNVFGVKAGRGWNGPVVEKVTTEYVNGVAHKTTDKFRVYGSYAEAFRDYASLLTNSPRYAGVVGQAQDAARFAKGLQRAGYATDPAYADKLVRVINGPTLRVSLQGEPPAQVLARR